MNMKRVVAWSGLVAFLLAAGPVLAQSAAQVSCTASSTGAAFGTYNPLSSAPTTVSTSVTVACTASGTQAALDALTPVNFTLSVSVGNSGSFSQRKLQSGANTLAYNLYTDLAYSAVLGDGTGGSLTLSGSASWTILSLSATASASETVYGRIPAEQNAAPGQYNDSLVITVNY